MTYTASRSESPSDDSGSGDLIFEPATILQAHEVIGRNLHVERCGNHTPFLGVDQALFTAYGHPFLQRSISSRLQHTSASAFSSSLSGGGPAVARR